MLVSPLRGLASPVTLLTDNSIDHIDKGVAGAVDSRIDRGGIVCDGYWRSAVQMGLHNTSLVVRTALGAVLVRQIDLKLIYLIADSAQRCLHTRAKIGGKLFVTFNAVCHVDLNLHFAHLYGRWLQITWNSDQPSAWLIRFRPFNSIGAFYCPADVLARFLVPQLADLRARGEVGSEGVEVRCEPTGDQRGSCPATRHTSCLLFHYWPPHRSGRIREVP